MQEPISVPALPKHQMFWKTAQTLSLSVTLLLIAGFFVLPEFSLNLLWNILIPLLPATFIMTPAIWRGLCPLATFNMFLNKLASRQSLPPKLIPVAGILGIVLFEIMVPARRFLFNENGIALGITVLSVAALALLLGSIFDRKAGFCNGICPVLPVERLYGQNPLFDIENPRCVPCIECTGSRCLDLNPRDSIALTIGDKYFSSSWLTTPFGVFAASFPGFVAGFYTTSNVAIAEAGSIYLNVILWSAGSYVLTNLVVRLLRIKTRLILALLAASAVGIYYWFSTSIIATALTLDETAAWVIRVFAAGLILVWFLNAKPWKERLPFAV